MNHDTARGPAGSPAPPAQRPARLRLSPEDRRQALIDAALDLFSSQPYDAVSVDDIARAAGMSRPLLYHYYGNKYGVFLAALQQSADRLTSAVTAAAHAAPYDWLIQGLHAYLRCIREDSLGFTALVGHGSGTATREETAILDSAREGILEAVVVGLALPEEPPGLLRSALRGWIGLVEVVSRDWLRAGEPVLEELAELLRELFGATVLTAARHDDRVATGLREARGLPGAGISMM
jgi:AcrR family transcriptional regulator